MGVVRLPQRFTSQPQNATGLTEKYRDAKILSLMSDVDGRDIARGNNLTYPAAPPSRVLRPHGYSLNFSGSSRLVSASSVSPGANFSVFAWVRPDVINFSYARIAETAYTTGFYLGSNNGNSSAAKYAFIVKGSSLEGCIGGDQSIGQRDFVVGTFGSLTRKLYVNGVQVASSAATTPTVTTDKVYIGHNSGGVNFWRGDIDTFGMLDRTLPPDEIWSLYQNPWQMFRAPPRRIFFSASSGIDLTGSASTQVNVSGSAAIAQSHVIVGSASTQSNSGATGAITQAHALTGAGSVQGNAASVGAISQTGDFVGAASTQANAASTASIAQIHVLTGATSAQGNVSGAGAISQGAVHDLTAATCTQANSSSTAVITQAHILVHAPSVQDNVASASAIVQAHILAAASSAQGNVSASGTIALPEASISSTVERTSVFRATVAHNAKFQRSKSVTARFN